MFISASLQTSRTFIFLLIILASTSIVLASSPDGVWENIPESSIGLSKGLRTIVPNSYRVYRLDIGALQTWFQLAPREFDLAAKPIEIYLPNPDGKYLRFNIEKSPIMEQGLAARFPTIQTFIAKGIDDPASTARLDWTDHGLHAMVLSPQGTMLIDPYRIHDTLNYISYYKKEYFRETKFECHVRDSIPKLQSIDSLSAAPVTLRTYRVAIGATGEYTQFHGGTVNDGLSAIVTTMNRVNGIYEREFAVRMILVANETSVIFTNPTTDPYTDGNAGAMLGQNQTTLDSVIGTANYDIGHVFGGSGGGGVAGLGVVCSGGSKAWGVTSLTSPVGDVFDVDYVSHEMGHQFDGNHSFNGTTGSCGGSRNSSTAYEPGSGSTIMAYAGICGTENLQPNSDDYFHVASFGEIFTFVSAGGGAACDVANTAGHFTPTSNAGNSYAIPKSTPFLLTGSGSDPDGDTLTYCWEEFDLGAAAPPNTDNGNRPIFRSFDPVLIPERTFPKLSDIINNTNTFGESLPITNRTLNFRLSVRDNHAGAGGQGIDSMQVTVSATAGPFLVTQPNTAVTWNTGTPETVIWNVAGTSGPPVNATNVDILLSTDGGNTFPTVLANDTPNDGSESITVPSMPTTTARIKVAASANIFFDLSNANFTIVDFTCPLITIDPPLLPDGQVGQAYNQTLTASGGSAPYTIAHTTGTLPSGLSLDSSGLLSGTPDTVGTFNFTVTATDSDDCTGTKSYSVNIVEASCPLITIDPPSLPDGQVGQAYNQTLSASGGTAPYTFAHTAGTLPSGLTLNSTGMLSGTPDTVGTFNFTVTVTDDDNCTGTKNYSVNITDTPCLFCDDFEDGMLDPMWTYLKPDWFETGGFLSATPSGRKAIAIANPVFTGCSGCFIEAQLQTAGGLYNKVWLLGWHQSKDDTVELMMKEESDRWVFKQRSGGLVVAKAKIVRTIEPDVDYIVRIAYDGTNFQVTIDGELVLTIPAGAPPNGTVGFQAKNTSARFGYIQVN